INPSHGIGPDFSQSGENGPSIFPNTSLGIRVLTTSGPWTFQAAVLDGVPGDPDHPDRSGIHLSADEGALLIAEVGHHTDSGARVAAGYWHYTAQFADLQLVDDTGEPMQRRGNAGVYVLAESPMFLSRDTVRGLRLFARTGYAEDNINPVRHYYGTGAVYTGWAARRPEDQVGFAIAIAEPGGPFRESQQLAGIATARREINYELTYRCPVTDWLTLQSDLQYIRDPGMDPTLDSAWVVGIRFEVGRSWNW
ncbi:MAG TPA: carbohydrate porin, partial [Povalibacter sp.]|nr:carbohydrate porin [Povalibacter sp.]